MCRIVKCEEQCILFEVCGETIVYCVAPVTLASELPEVQKAKEVLRYWVKDIVQSQLTGWGQNQEQHLILLIPCWVPSLFPSQHGFHPYICAKRPFQIFLANGEHCFVLPVSTWLSYLLMRLSHMRKLEN